ncbi:MAG: zinc ABC transporter substrate-binding protein [Deltaproteobacteria bacterium]|nr:zinc ABC transporter substrate-binding protein [Deltaproteobacteria bacterium]
MNRYAFKVETGWAGERIPDRNFQSATKSRIANRRSPFLGLILLLLPVGGALHASEAPVIHVVTTLPDYASVAKAIGGARVEVEAMVAGNQNAHFVRPKPSFAALLGSADVLIETGLDLEMWLPAVVDRAGNPRILSGQAGYVAAARGVAMLDKPSSVSAGEGDLHVYGNPHITVSPVNIRVVARNVALGMARADPGGKELYEKNLAAFLNDLDERLFGKELAAMLGGDTLASLAEQGKLADFLATKKYKGKALAEYAGGWWKAMAPLRGARIVTYHRTWTYFFHLFGLVEAGTLEPKPGIPPSTRHVADLIETMRKDGVKIVLSENYFSESDVTNVAEKTGAQAVIVPVYVGGAPGADDYFKLVDHWVSSLKAAAEKAGAPEKKQGD